MRSKLLLLFIVVLFSIGVSAQDAYIISGKLYDSVSNQILSGATIRIKGTNIGTITKEDGSFQFKTSQKLPILLTVSSIGYKTAGICSRWSGYKHFSRFKYAKLIGGSGGSNSFQKIRKHSTFTCNN